MNFDRKEVKSEAKRVFKSHYWPSIGEMILCNIIPGICGVAVSIILYIIIGASFVNTIAEVIMGANPDILLRNLSIFGVASIFISCSSALIALLVKYPITIGYKLFLLNCHEDENSVGDLFLVYKEKELGNVAFACFITDLICYLWSILFYIPGIIAQYKYRMVPFLLAEYPSMTGSEARAKSKEMMNGNKWKAFVFDLSFIGWFLLSAVTFGLAGLFFAYPYYNQACAELYIALNVKTQRVFTYSNDWKDDEENEEEREEEKPEKSEEKAEEKDDEEESQPVKKAAPTPVIPSPVQLDVKTQRVFTSKALQGFTLAEEPEAEDDGPKAVKEESEDPDEDDWDDEEDPQEEKEEMSTAPIPAEDPDADDWDDEEEDPVKEEPAVPVEKPLSARELRRLAKKQGKAE